MPHLDGDPHWRLARRYGKAPYHSPVDERLVQMLRAIFDDDEAALVACFPLGAAGPRALARRCGLELGRVEALLAAIDRRGAILAFELGAARRYALLPIVPGLFELYMCG